MANTGTSEPNSKGKLSYLLSDVAYTPARLFCSGIFSALQPFAPQFIPVLICICLIPLAILISVFAGFLVWKDVAVSWHLPIHLQFGDGTPPYALTHLPKLAPQQRYDISVLLTVPAIESNFALGNFMTTLTLSTPSNQTLASIRRPAIVFPPRSSFFQRIPATVSLTVPMLPTFIPGSSKVVAFVEVGRRDSWTSIGSREGREISVISASIRGSVVHHGIRGLIARFPIISALISVITFFAILMFVLSACMLSTIVWRISEDITNPEAEGETILEGSSHPPSRTSSTETGRRSLSKRRRARSTGNVQSRSSTQTSMVTIPQETIESRPLRRRASRISDRLSDADSW